MCTCLTFIDLVASASVIHAVTNSRPPGMPHASRTGTMVVQVLTLLSLSPLECYHWLKCEIPQLKLFYAVSYNFVLDSKITVVPLSQVCDVSMRTVTVLYPQITLPKSCCKLISRKLGK